MRLWLVASRASEGGMWCGLPRELISTFCSAGADCHLTGLWERNDAKFWRFVTESADILLRVGKQGVGRSALQLVVLLTDTSPEINVFRRHIESLWNSGHLRARKTGSVIKHGGFRRVPVRGSKSNNNGYCALHVKDATKVPRKQIEVCGKEGIVLYPQRENTMATVVSSNIATD